MPHKTAKKPLKKRTSKSLSSTRKAKKQAHSKTWRKAAKVRRAKNARKELVLKYVSIFALFTISFLFLFAVVSYKKLTLPFASASSNTSSDIKNEELYVISLLVVDNFESDTLQTNTAYKIFLNFENNLVHVYKLDGNLQLDVMGKYTYEPLSKIALLGKSINNNTNEKGFEMTDQTMQNLFGYASNRYIVVDENMRLTAERLFLEGKSEIPLSLDFLNMLNKSVITDFSASEMYYVYQFMTSLPAGSIVISEVKESHVDEPEILDKQIRDITFDSIVAREKKNIAVLNGTSLPGLATFGSRVITNLGGRVISSDNATKHYEESVLIVDDKNSESVKQIQQFFDVAKVVEKDNSNYYENEVIRADIVLILGLDMENRL